MILVEPTSSPPDESNPEDALSALLRALGVTLVAGVPCSHLSTAIAAATRRGHYVAAANEGTALAIAAGASLAGGLGAVLAQNSGLGNLLNPLTSVLQPAQIPVLTVLSLRGCPDPDRDEPQHRVMGPATRRVLNSVGVTHLEFPKDEGELSAVVDQLHALLSQRQPCFLLVPRGRLEPGRAPVAPASSWTAAAAISALTRHVGDALLFSTTGYLSRQVFARADRPSNFYVQGGMGHASSLALGVALSRPERRVLVVDGDGAFLMHMGAAATVAALKGPNLTHIVFDNGSYESTGAQPSTSFSLDWQALGLALGYRYSVVARDRAGFEEALDVSARVPGPHLLTVQVDVDGAVAPPRASSSATLPELTRRFSAEVARQ